MTDRPRHAAEPLLTVRGLTAWYKAGSPVLNIRELDIGQHSVVGLLGTNGAGKTTLINTLVGVHEHASLQHMTWRSRATQPRDKGFQLGRYAVFTESSGFAYWSLDPYLRFTSRVFGRSPTPSRVDDLVAGFGFEPFRRKTIGSLSTGNRKKAFLIAGLSLGVPLLILDEPVDGLDFEGTEFLYDSLNAYRDTGSVLMSSHVAESFTQCCDHLYVLDGGDLSRPYPLDPATDIRALLKERNR